MRTPQPWLEVFRLAIRRAAGSDQEPDRQLCANYRQLCADRDEDEAVEAYRHSRSNRDEVS